MSYLKYSKNQSWILLLIMFVLVSSSGCSHLSVNKVEDGETFTGIRSLYHTEVSNGDTLQDTVNVLFVHGMGVHDEGYSDELQTGLAKKLNMTKIEATKEEFEIDINDYKIAKLKRTQFISNENKKLYLVEMNWSIGTTPIKEHFLNVDKNKKFKENGELESNRLKLNSIFKAFVNEKLSDPIIYSGNFKRHLQDAISQAVCWTMTPPEVKAIKTDNKCNFNNATTKNSIVILSASLGSTMVFDTVLNYKPDKGLEALEMTAFNDMKKRFAAQTSHIFMMANQLPLIELSMLDEPKGVDWPINYYPDICSNEQSQTLGLSGFIQERDIQLRSMKSTLKKSEPELQQPELQVIAFNDPNDLLTYELSCEFKKSCKDKGVNIVNVTFTNASTGYLFLFANPIEAHTGFKKKEKFYDYIVDGYKK